MAQTELERRFDQEMRESLPELKQLGYVPSYFIRMMNERGAAQAIRDLIDSANPSEGLTRLWEMRRLDLSAEAIVADKPEWADLFNDEQREKARRRLNEFGYEFQARSSNPMPDTSLTTSDPFGNMVEKLPIDDGRLKALANVTLRPYQTEFREALRRRYGDGCQITECSIMAVVQACHFVSVSEKGTDEPMNGLLLRVDLHILFDADLIAIDLDTMTVHLATELTATDYARYEGKSLRLRSEHPNRAALKARWAQFVARGKS